MAWEAGDLSPNQGFQLKSELGREKGPSYNLYYERKEDKMPNNS